MTDMTTERHGRRWTAMLAAGAFAVAQCAAAEPAARSETEAMQQSYVIGVNEGDQFRPLAHADFAADGAATLRVDVEGSDSDRLADAFAKLTAGPAIRVRRPMLSDEDDDEDDDDDSVGVVPVDIPKGDEEYPAAVVEKLYGDYGFVVWKAKR